MKKYKSKGKLVKIVSAQALEERLAPFAAWGWTENNHGHAYGHAK